MFAHTKIAAVMLGGIQIVWALLAIGPDDSLFTAYLAMSGLAQEWGAIMFCNGLLLLIGSMCPWRSGRHIGLALGCFIMLALGGYFFQQGLFTPVTALMPFLGLMSLITLLAEVQGKPRGKF